MSTPSTLPKLPSTLIFDYGSNNLQKFESYRFRSSQYKERDPKQWRVYAKNDNTDWTLLDDKKCDCTNYNVFITSHRGQQLQDDNNNVRLTNNDGGWEEWDLILRDNEKYLIRSYVHNRYLEDRSDRVKLHADQGAYQEWTFHDAGDDKWFIRSHRGENLGDNGGSLRLNVNADERGKWTIKTKDGTKSCLKECPWMSGPADFSFGTEESLPTEELDPGRHVLISAFQRCEYGYWIDGATTALGCKGILENHPECDQKRSSWNILTGKSWCLHRGSQLPHNFRDSI
jgi:hypothetical protein